ncbi:hypothetical protein KCU93_g201, partial [Aureobasidium melanogenum]
MLTEGKVLYAAITSSNRPLLHSAMNSSLTALVLIVREDDMEVLEDEQDDLAELKNPRFRHDCAFVGRVQRKKSSKDAGSTMTARVRPDRPVDKWGLNTLLTSNLKISRLALLRGQEAFRSSEVVKSAPHVARERIPFLLDSICVFGSPSMVAQGTDDDRRPSQFDCIAVIVLRYSPSTCMSFLKKHPAVYECALVLRPGLNIFSIFCDLKDIGSSEHYSVIIGRCKRACHHEFRILIPGWFRKDTTSCPSLSTISERALALLHLPLLEQHDPFETAAPTDVIDVHSLEMFVEPSPPKPRQSLYSAQSLRLRIRYDLAIETFCQKSRRMLRDVLSRARVLLLEEAFKPVSIVSRTRNVFGLQMIRLGPLPKHIRVRGKQLLGRSIYVNTTGSPTILAARWSDSSVFVTKASARARRNRGRCGYMSGRNESKSKRPEKRRRKRLRKQLRQTGLESERRLEAGRKWLYLRRRLEGLVGIAIVAGTRWTGG